MSDEQKPKRSGLIGAIQARQKTEEPAEYYRSLLQALSPTEFAKLHEPPTLEEFSSQIAPQLPTTAIDVADKFGGLTGIITLQKDDGEWTVVDCKIIDPPSAEDQP